MLGKVSNRELNAKTGIPYIQPQELKSLLEASTPNLFILDCRFTLEFESGHIKSAIHATTLDDLEGIFFSFIREDSILVFHCEFSHIRGPLLASSFRELDRELNKQTYPNLFYPNLFILKGGFKLFSELYPSYIEGFYLPMKSIKQKKSLLKWKRSQKKQYNTLPSSSQNLSPLFQRSSSDVRD